MDLMSALQTAPWLPQASTSPPDPAEDPRGEPGAPQAEWLETDGRGGYACLTASWTPRRRYHGLLTAVPDGTARRHLFLAGLLDRLTVGAAETTLTRLRREGDPPVLEASCIGALESVPWHRARLELGGAVLLREVLVLPGRRAVLIRYTLDAESEAELALEPLLAFRASDALTFANDVARTETERTEADGLRFRLYDALPALSLHVDGVPREAWTWEGVPRWHRGIEYSTDLARGYGGHEDLLAPGRLRVQLQPGEALTLAATIDGPILEGAALFDAETERRLAVLPDTADLATRIGAASGAFLYRGPGSRRGVLAGFPWFGEWGRDTFIALPGLTLARGDLATCADVLGEVLPYLRGGLLPNIFGHGVEDSHYGSADAALWFARAALLFDRAGGGPTGLQGDLSSALVAIAEAYRDGTDPRTAALGIRVDDAWGLHVGSPDRNPTWMDAQTPSGPVTPRHGYPVEINALWCSLLLHVAEHTGDAAWGRAARQAGRTFLARFWREDEGVLADVWDAQAPDVSIRPNMVLAASLELSPLGREQRARILVRAETDLLTPYGLRTLAPRDPAYCGRYGGDPEARDGAYHQGTVWPWLLGCYVETALRVDASEANRVRLRGLFESLGEELGRGGLGHLAEVYDGDAPHRRGGTFAQAWSTAEAMRALALLDGSLPMGGDGAP